MAINIQAPQLALEGYLRAKQLQQEQARQEQLHEEAQSQLAEVGKFHAGQLNLQQKHLALTQAALKEHLKQIYMENVAKGIQQPGGESSDTGNAEGGVSEAQPTVNTTGEPAIGGLGGAPIGPVGQAETQAKVSQILGPIQAQQAGAVEKAKGQAGLEVANSPEAIALGQRQHAFEMQKLAAQGANLESVAKIHGLFQNQSSNIMAWAHIRAAQIANELYSNPDVVEGAFNGTLNGTQDLNGLPGKTKLSVEKMYNEKGWVVPDPKMQKDLENLKPVDKLLGDYLELANDYSRDGDKNGGGLNPLNMIDVKGREASLNSQGGILARQFDPQSRIAKSLIESQQSGLFSPWRSKAQNLANIEAHRKTLNTEINAHFDNLPPDEKNVIMGRRGIHLFGGFDQTTPTGSSVPEGRVAVINPKGQPVHIPKAQLQDALKQGYKPMQVGQ